MSDALPAAWFYRLKAAQRDLIARAGGIERSADLASMSKSQVGRFNNAGDPDLMPLPAVLMLEAECASPLVTAVMAELNGRRLADAEVGDTANASIMASHAEVVVQAGELMAKGAIAFADGRLTPSEAAGIDRSAASLENAVSNLRQATASARVNGLSVVGSK
ncbi:hypothetical protein EN829_014900 [Mesorhizobium sp. M00.F.Ca.ET.186.01.1.1]|nr:hypothetical protein EN848_14535 [bacterium M00.F.Ca.ET.205.01.1.1]TGU52972.1 hypothetical protein EN795_14860 [bacterium M00.F.Ca.ET.152.01.1.1]TGV36164.1 hypothetical protein EN829_014900 [Mesorhizobium sp. M00.F.Ca.ET.186.01.1.1]TGZ43524.1 hypothetical protein EN805_10470 [bacterium M00.F.Ca.ET.162.01.1.1]